MLLNLICRNTFSCGRIWRPGNLKREKNWSVVRFDINIHSLHATCAHRHEPGEVVAGKRSRYWEKAANRENNGWNILHSANSRCSRRLRMATDISCFSTFEPHANHQNSVCTTHYIIQIHTLRYAHQYITEYYINHQRRACIMTCILVCTSSIGFFRVLLFYALHI